MYTVVQRVMRGNNVVGYILNTGESLKVDEFKWLVKQGQVLNCEIHGEAVTGVNGFKLKELPQIQLEGTYQPRMALDLVSILISLSIGNKVNPLKPEFNIIGVCVLNKSNNQKAICTLAEYMLLAEDTDVLVDTYLEGQVKRVSTLGAIKLSEIKKMVNGVGIITYISYNQTIEDGQLYRIDSGVFKSAAMVSDDMQNILKAELEKAKRVEAEYKSAKAQPTSTATATNKQGKVTMGGLFKRFGFK